MDVIWFVSVLVIGVVVGLLLGYCAACLSILHKVSVKGWEIVLEQERDHDFDE